MSGIYIPNMEMPESCTKCRFLEGVADDGLCHVAEKWLDDEYFAWHLYADGDIDDSKPLNCPLVPIPDHGRLVDADALRREMYHETFETDSPMQKWDSGCWIRYKMFERAEENAPTVIPADNGIEIAHLICGKGENGK